jgi:hypothetical protein
MQLQQAQQQVVPIVYIGKKDYKTDNVNHTKTVWQKPGDVQPYPLDKAASLLRHSEVWKLGKASDLVGAAVVDDAGAVQQAGETKPRAETNADITKNTNEAATETQADTAKQGPAVATGKSARTLE